MKGAKEARWNNKYMRIIEKPVKQIELTDNLVDIQQVIIALLKSLKNIYQNSNFYKEARIVSFVDRLLDCIKLKLRSKLNLQQSIRSGIHDYENYTALLEQGKNIVQKFLENFFLLEIMEQDDKMTRFAKDQNQEEQKQSSEKYDENNEEA